MRQRSGPTPDEFYRWIVDDTARARAFLSGLNTEARRGFAQRCSDTWPGDSKPNADMIITSWIGAGHCQAEP